MVEGLAGFATDDERQAYLFKLTANKRKYYKFWLGSLKAAGL